MHSSHTVEPEWGGASSYRTDCYSYPKLYPPKMVLKILGPSQQLDSVITM